MATNNNPDATPYASANDNGNNSILPLMVHVTAPATLPAGYTFEAEINGDPTKVFHCEVPDGGVEEGQVFLAPLPDNFDAPRLQAPTGRWKDGLCQCCTNTGVCHASVWCGACCPQLALGQVLTRMQLTWLGEPGPIVRTRHTWMVVVVLVVSFYIYSTCLQLAAASYAVGEAPSLILWLKFLGNFLFSLWAIYSLCRARETVRARYQIPEERCVGCEDCLCAVCCAPCTVCQLLRHTGEYESYPAVCCSKSGHPPGTPLVV